MFDLSLCLKTTNKSINRKTEKTHTQRIRKMQKEYKKVLQKVADCQVL